MIGGETQDVRLKLTEDYLSLQKEELAFTVSCTDHVDAAVLAKVKVAVTQQHTQLRRVGVEEYVVLVHLASSIKFDVIIKHPSVCRLPPVVCHPSSVVRDLSCYFCRLSSVVRRP